METKAIKKVTCCICGKEEDASQWCDSWANEMVKHQVCFNCNHWRRNYVKDCKSKPHTWAIVDGGHYRLHPHTDSWPVGFGGKEFKFRFNDGTIVECDNVWFQGNIKDAHPHWTNVMPNNAILIHNGKREYHQINELIDEELKARFCDEHNIEDIDLLNGHVIGTIYECTEEYYGNRLIQPVIVASYEIQYVEDWMEEQLHSSK